MSDNHYILVNKKVVSVDLDAFLKWYSKADRQLFLTKCGDVEVSTVFLGIDHNFSRTNNIPIVFETMVFRVGSLDEVECKRYSSYEEAEKGHVEMLKTVLKKYA